MAEQKNFLLEVGCEELPPKSLQKLASSLAENIAAGLESVGLSYEGVVEYAAPRRLAIHISSLSTQQDDKDVEKRGPALQAAFDSNGQPTKACEGFARSCDTTVDKLEKLETDKGAWMVYRFHQAGKTAAELLPELINQALAKLPIPKPMRWGANETQFIRPVHWVVMLLENEIIPATILGITVDRVTCGHRVHGQENIAITDADTYLKQLQEQGYVIADHRERRRIIADAAAKLAQEKGLTAIINDELLDEVTGLVEWPVPLMIAFEKSFLRVPAEALIAAMADHQKCFHVVDDANQLQPYFITVSNIESKDVEQVIKGNQRVMRARLADAAFFFDADQKHNFEDYLPQLKNVTFQAKLGSLYDKAVRLGTLAHSIALHMNVDADAAQRAGLLAKCDLVSDMVGEFPELQGIMGKYYAQAANEPEAISLAIEEHYLPRFAKDRLPESDIGAAVALAERIDTLVGIFGINEIPTGEKDPFGLRRAALGVIAIILNNDINVQLTSLLEKATLAYGDALANKNVVNDVHQYILERLRAWYHDKNISADVLAAVLARQTDSLQDLDRRVNAVNEFRQLADASALAAANKRVSRLLQKENKLMLDNAIDHKLLTDAAELALAEKIESIGEQVAPLYARGDYSEALSELANLRSPVDKFFDDVMVMVEEEDIRNNRLAMLAKLRNLFLHVADISLLQ